MFFISREQKSSEAHSRRNIPSWCAHINFVEGTLELEKARQKSAGTILTGILLLPFLSLVIAHSRTQWKGGGVEAKDLSSGWVQARAVKFGSSKSQTRPFHSRVNVSDSHERMTERATSLDSVHAHDAEMDPDGLSN